MKDFSEIHTCDKVWEEIKLLPREMLLHLLNEYNDYMWRVINEEQGEPVCVAEFYAMGKE